MVRTEMQKQKPKAVTTVQIDRETMRLVKILAAHRDCSYTQIVEEAVRAYIGKDDANARKRSGDSIG